MSKNKNFWSTSPLPRYEASKKRENGISYIVDHYGNRLPSFSTIINATKSPAEKVQFTRWRKNVGKVEAGKIISGSKQRGKLGNRHLESYLKGEDVPCPELIQPHWENLLPILDNIDEVRLFDGDVFHFYDGYAGRVKCVASFDETPCLIDFKFCDRLKPLYDEPLQLAAYCAALNRQYGPRHGVWLKHALLIVATPDDAVKTWFDTDEMNQYSQRWQERVAQFWQQIRANA